jgi:hypothetical protein
MEVRGARRSALRCSNRGYGARENVSSNTTCEKRAPLAEAVLASAGSSTNNVGRGDADRGSACGSTSSRAGGPVDLWARQTLSLLGARGNAIRVARWLVRRATSLTPRDVAPARAALRTVGSRDRCSPQNSATACHGHAEPPRLLDAGRTTLVRAPRLRRITALRPRAFSRTFQVGRAGIEPATLGLRDKRLFGFLCGYVPSARPSARHSVCVDARLPRLARAFVGGEGRFRECLKAS